MRKLINIDQNCTFDTDCKECKNGYFFNKEIFENETEGTIEIIYQPIFCGCVKKAKFDKEYIISDLIKNY